MHKKTKILILGFGYTTKFLLNESKSYFRTYDINVTSRTKDDCIRFHFEDENTWKNINTEYDLVIWTFPVKDIQLLKKFLKLKQHYFKTMIMIGTTSAYRVEYENQCIDETSHLVENNKRTESDLYIQNNNGIIVRSAGIYGPGRDPKEWARQGRVQATKRYVNWIHVKDLVQHIYNAFLYGKKGANYIACDSQPVSWEDFFNFYKIKPNLNEAAKKKNKISKKINSSWTLEQLNIKLNYKSILHK